MEQSTAERCRELEAKVQVLEKETELLAERAEEILLLGLIAENIDHLDDRTEILAHVLERISILKNIPYCACCALEDGSFRVLSVYAGFRLRAVTGDQIALSASVLEALSLGAHVVSGGEHDKEGISIDLEGGGFVPYTVAILPFQARDVPLGVFVLADDDRTEDRLSPRIVLLQRIVDMVVTKLDNLSLVQELSRLNAELDRKVEARTRELRSATEKLQQEAAAQHRLITAVEQLAEAVIITGTDDNIRYVNAAFERITGFRRAELVGKSLHVLQDDRLDAALQQRIWQAIAEGEVWQERLEYEAQDGSLLVLDSTIAPVRNRTGEIVDSVTTIRDVTREAQLEQQFQQAVKMEALGRLAGGIAHDFNNLLTVIRISTQLLERRLHPQDPLWDHVQQIQETGDRASRLTRQLLRFSRHDVVEAGVLDLNDIISSLRSMLQRVVSEDIEFEMVLVSDACPVKMDTSQAEQVIVNLVVNACDAMPQGGVLVIETANVVLDASYTALHVGAQPGEHVLFTISDTGVGMPDEVKARAFEPFFTTKVRGQGTGLGLASVFGIVKQSGGHIRVHSEVGLGTTFKVYLPRAGETWEESASTSRSLSQVAEGLLHGTETILIAEDQAHVRNLAARVLESCGYLVLTASNGVEALEVSQVHDGPIHLLLTDVVMPHMSGRELAGQLQSQRPELQTLYMSGYAEDAIIHYGVPSEGSAFLSKPFTLETLTRTVRTVLAVGT